MVERTCKTCGRTFTTYPSQPRKYCSQECMSKDKTVEKICAYCGKHYITPKSLSDRLYCSRKCMNADEKHGQRISAGSTKERVTVYCKTCGKPIEVLVSKASRKKYCSRSCRSSDPDIIAKLSRGAKVLVTCKTCGKQFYRMKSQVREEVYCSFECMQNRVTVTCDYCGQELERTPATNHSHNFCDEVCWKAYYAKPEFTCEWCGKKFQRGLAESGYHNFCSRRCSEDWLRNSPDAEPIREASRKRLNTRLQDPNFVEKMRTGWAGAHKINKLETFVAQQFLDEIHFTGNGQIWVTLKDGSKKCPDFKVHGQRKFIEIWGDFWHRDEDPDKLVLQYASIGFECLVIWESEIKKNWEGVSERIARFCQA